MATIKALSFRVIDALEPTPTELRCIIDSIISHISHLSAWSPIRVTQWPLRALSTTVPRPPNLLKRQASKRRIHQPTKFLPERSDVYHASKLFRCSPRALSFLFHHYWGVVWALLQDNFSTKVGADSTARPPTSYSASAMAIPRRREA